MKVNESIKHIYISVSHTNRHMHSEYCTIQMYNIIIIIIINRDESESLLTSQIAEKLSTTTALEVSFSYLSELLQEKMYIVMINQFIFSK